MKTPPLPNVLPFSYPIMFAPMAGVSGGALPAAVSSNAAALSMPGGGYCDPQRLRRELDLLAAATRPPKGIGLINWEATRETVEVALSYEPHALFLSFGDASRYAEAVKACGCALVC